MKSEVGKMEFARFRLFLTFLIPMMVAFMAPQRESEAGPAGDPRFFFANPGTNCELRPLPIFARL